MSDLRNDELGTGASSVSAVGDEGPVEDSRLDTRLMGRPEKFNGQHAMWLGCKFQIEAYFGFLFGGGEGEGAGTLRAAELETNSVTMISLTTDTSKVQAQQTCFIRAERRNTICAGESFLAKLQIGESGTTKCSTATKEVLGDRNVLSVPKKNVRPSLGAQVQLNLGARPTCAGVRNPIVEYRLSKRQWNPTRHHAAHDDWKFQIEACCVFWGAGGGEAGGWVVVVGRREGGRGVGGGGGAEVVLHEGGRRRVGGGEEGGEREVQTRHLTKMSVYSHRILVAEHLGVISQHPRHPRPRPNGGGPTLLMQRPDG